MTVHFCGFSYFLHAGYYFQIFISSVRPFPQLQLLYCISLNPPAHHGRCTINMFSPLHCCPSNADVSLFPTSSGIPLYFITQVETLGLSLIALSRLMLVYNELPSLPLEPLPCWALLHCVCRFSSVLGPLSPTDFHSSCLADRSGFNYRTSLRLLLDRWPTHRCGNIIPLIRNLW